MEQFLYSNYRTSNIQSNWTVFDFDVEFNIICSCRNTGISHKNGFHSLNQEISISHSISIIKITKQYNSTVFNFDDVNIICVSMNTGVSHWNSISFTQSWDSNITFNFNHENHEKIELNWSWFWCCNDNRCE